MSRRSIPVFTLKSGGKVAPGTDVHRRAMVRAADLLDRSGRGGGISSLLLPVNEKERKRLELDRATYQLRRVRPRSIGERGKARELSMIEVFLCEAILLKGSNLSAWKAKHFLGWIISELQDDTSPIYRLAKYRYGLLLEHPRKLRWWQQRVSELKKCRVKDGGDLSP